MTEKAIVVAAPTRGGIDVTVVPFLKDACRTCSAGCAKKGAAFTVKNPKRYELRPGTVVLLSAPRGMQAVQGLVSLFLPFMSAIAGYFLAPAIMRYFSIQAGDGYRALFVIAFLLASSALIVLITRVRPLPGKPEIIETY